MVTFDRVYEDYIDQNLCYDIHTGLIWWRTLGSNSRKIDDPVGSVMSSGHVSVGLYPKGHKRLSVLAHRLGWRLHYGAWPDGDLDHINGIRDDNRISNLRVADRSENNVNSKKYKNNSSGYKGVHELPCGRFKSRIQFRGSRLSLGIFNTAEEAYEAYKEAAKDIHGEFARL